MESIPRLCRFVLRSLYDVQVLTASIQFLGRGENVAECDGGKDLCVTKLSTRSPFSATKPLNYKMYKDVY